MEQNNQKQRLRTFLWVLVGSLILAIGYIVIRGFWSTGTSNAGGQGDLADIADAGELQSIQSEPFVVYINQQGTYQGKVKITALDSTQPQSAQTDLSCDRVYFAAGNGICLRQDRSVLSPRVQVMLFGSDFTPKYQFVTEGIFSRARVSPDGKFAAYTVFVSGHSYNDVNLSTATILLDTSTGASLGNLEEFETWKDGQLFQSPEFNFWGVTFGADSNVFYATLRAGGINYLVQGDVAARTLTVLHENLECPSLSPDGTRIAFKKPTPEGIWKLTILDLSTMQETPLAEIENIDDQLEWLDDQHVLYQKADSDSPPGMSIFVIPADGSGQPEVFLSKATSPAIVR